jgi:hypothetical protein
MSSLSVMLSSEIASLRAQAAALLSKAATLESALATLAPAEAAVPPAAAAVPEPQPQPQPEAVAEPEAAKVKKAPHPWALFFQRVCAILKAAGYRGSLISVQPLWKQSHEWADADIVPAWLAFKAEAAAAAASASEAALAAAASGGGGSAAAAAEPAAKPKAKKPKAKAPMTPEQRAARMALHACEVDGMTCYANARGDVFSTDMLWLGHWTGTTLDMSAPEPADFDEITVVE